ERVHADPDRAHRHRRRRSAQQSVRHPDPGRDHRARPRSDLEQAARRPPVPDRGPRGRCFRPEDPDLGEGPRGARRQEPHERAPESARGLRRYSGGREGQSPREGPTSRDGDRLRRGRRPVLLQRAAAPGGGEAREEGGSRPHGPQGRLRSRWGVARQRGRRVARMRERLRGDWPASGRRGRPPTPGRRRKPSDRRRARRRRAILAVHSVRDGGGRGPGGRPMRKVGVIGAGMTLFRRRLQETGKEMCFEATKMALDSAGLTRADIDMVVNGTAPDAFDGVHMKGEYLLDGCGGYRKPYTRVFTGGGTGVFSSIAGWWHVASGLADAVLVVN